MNFTAAIFRQALKHILIALAAFHFASSALADEEIENDISDIYEKETGKIAGITNLMSAVTNSDIDGVRFFLKSDPESIDKKNIGGATALHIAARLGNLEAATMLLNANANVSISDSEGFTPLMRAALSKSPEIVQALLAHHASASALNYFKESAIVHAAISGCAECLSMILYKSDITPSLRGLDTQLSEASKIASNRSDELMEEILKNYSDEVKKSFKETQRNTKFFFKGSKDEKSPIVAGEQNVPVKIIEKPKTIPSNNSASSGAYKIKTPEKSKKADSNYKLIHGAGAQIPSVISQTPSPRFKLKPGVEPKTLPPSPSAETPKVLNNNSGKKFILKQVD